MPARAPRHPTGAPPRPAPGPPTSSRSPSRWRSPSSRGGGCVLAAAGARSSASLRSPRLGRRRRSCSPARRSWRGRRGVGRPAARRPRAVRRLGDGRRATRSRSPGATRVVLSIDGERFEVWVRGRVRRRRAADVAGRRPGARRRRARAARRPAAGGASPAQHVVGELDADWVGDVAPGGRAADASNRVRDVIDRGAAHLPRRPGRADPRPRDRRRPRPAAGDGRALPRRRPVAPDGRVRAERRLPARRRGPAAAAAAAAGAVGRDARR